MVVTFLRRISPAIVLGLRCILPHPSEAVFNLVPEDRIWGECTQRPLNRNPELRRASKVTSSIVRWVSFFGR